MVETLQGKDYVVSRIIFDEIRGRLEDYGFLDPAEKLDPKRVSIFDSVFIEDCRQTLIEAGVEEGFPIVLVSDEREQSEFLEITGYRSGFEDSFQPVYNLTLFSGLFYSSIGKPLELKLRARSFPGAFMPPRIIKERLSIDNEMVEATEGNVFIGRGGRDEYGLLLVKRDGKIFVGGVQLPPEWAEGLKDGKLLGSHTETEVKAASEEEVLEEIIKPLLEREPEVLNASPEPGGSLIQVKEPEKPAEVEGVSLSPEAQKIAQLIKDGSGAEAFKEIKSRFERFPRYTGPAINKDGVKTGIFGREATPTEVEIGENEIKVTFMGVDESAMRRLYGQRSIAVENFVNAFRAESQGQDRFVLTISLDEEDEIKSEGRFVIWDPGSGQLVDSTNYLGKWATSPEFQELLRDRANLIPQIVFNIHEKQYYEVPVKTRKHRYYDDDDRPSRGRHYEPRESIDWGQASQARRSFVDMLDREIERSYPARDTTAPRGTVSWTTKDSPEDKKQYRTKKAARSKVSKVQAKNASKGKGKSKS